MPEPSTRILLISGSVRSGSTNSAALRTAAAAAPLGVDAVSYDGLLELPHFNPDDDEDDVAPPVAELRRQIGAADALLLCTPEYAGALPGAFKNLLEWTVGDAGTYEKPVGWVNVSPLPTGAADAYHSLGLVLAKVHADVVPAACVHVAVTRQLVGPDGLIADGAVRAALTEVLQALRRHVRDRG